MMMRHVSGFKYATRETVYGEKNGEINFFRKNVSSSYLPIQMVTDYTYVNDKDLSIHTFSELSICEVYCGVMCGC